MSQIIALDLRREKHGEIERLETVVWRRLNGRLRNFRLVMSVAGLILRGETTTFHAKQLAQHAVMEATELPIFANEILVNS